jgi:hypothetical protein
MAILEILIQARDATAQAWASASSSVQRYGQTTATSGQQVDRLTTRIGFQQRQLAILEQQLRDTTGRHMADSVAVQRSQLAYDRLNDSLQQNIQRQRQAGTGAGAAVLPRTFAGFTRQGALEALGGLGVATGLGEIAGQLRNVAQQGHAARAAIDSTTASLGVQLGSVQRASEIWSEGAAFAERYKITQQDLAEALTSSAQIIRTSTSSTEDLLSVLGRLQVLNPAEGFKGAAFALAELASGDIVSLNERFRIGRDAAHDMADEIRGGADAVAVLGRYLESAGITDRALETSLAGAAGESRAWARAMEDLSLEIDAVGRSMGIFSGAADLIHNTADEIDKIRSIGREFSRDLNAAGDAVLNGPFGVVIRALDRLEDWASDQLRGSFTAYAPPDPEAFGRAALPGVMASSYGRAGAAPVVNNITVQGSIITEQQATDMIHKGLLQKQQQSGYLGITGRP